MMIKQKTIDEYISSFPGQTQLMLSELRDTIKQVVPEAEEVISYAMPAFKLKKILVYYAGHQNHIGFYPTSSGIKAFENELFKYKYSKGAVQFPLDQPLPLSLIKKMVAFRVSEVM